MGRETKSFLGVEIETPFQRAMLISEIGFSSLTNLYSWVYINNAFSAREQGRELTPQELRDYYFGLAMTYSVAGEFSEGRDSERFKRKECAARKRLQEIS